MNVQSIPRTLKGSGQQDTNLAGIHSSRDAPETLLWIILTGPTRPQGLHDMFIAR